MQEIRNIRIGSHQLASSGFDKPKEVIAWMGAIQAQNYAMYNIAFVISDSGWVAIDRNETILLYPFIFENGPDYVREGPFRFVENNKMGFADTDCKKIISAIFDFVTPFEDGIAIYTLGGYEKGYLNHSAQLFTKVAELQNGTREAWTKDNEYVLLNEKGEFVKRIE